MAQLSFRLLSILIAMAIAPLSSGHGGGLNEYDCHGQSSDNTYHCHSGPLDGLTFTSEQTLIDAYNAAVSNLIPAPNPEIVVPGVFIPAYNRDDYMTSWRDLDSDCMDGRHEVLLIESRIPPTLDSSGCYVQSGEWHDPFTGPVFTDPSELQIDHMVPLKEAHVSGAHAWESARKSAYAQDLLNAKALIAVSGSANQSKGSRDPAQWLPPNTAHHCEYVRNWTEVKYRYALSFDEAEKAAIENVLGTDIALALRAESAGWDEIERRSSSAAFGLGIRKQDRCGYTRQALPTDQIEVTVSILPDAAHLGQEFDIFLVAELPSGLHSLDMWGNFIPFNGDMSTLVAHRSNIYLAESHEVSVFTGALNDELVFNLFIGYGTDRGDFVYTQAPLPLRISH